MYQEKGGGGSRARRNCNIEKTKREKSLLHTVYANAGTFCAKCGNDSGDVESCMQKCVSPPPGNVISDWFWGLGQ